MALCPSYQFCVSYFWISLVWKRNTFLLCSSHCYFGSSVTCGWTRSLLIYQASLISKQRGTLRVFADLTCSLPCGSDKACLSSVRGHTDPYVPCLRTRDNRYNLLIPSVFHKRGKWLHGDDGNSQVGWRGFSECSLTGTWGTERTQRGDARGADHKGFII